MSTCKWLTRYLFWKCCETSVHRCKATFSEAIWGDLVTIDAVTVTVSFFVSRKNNIKIRTMKSCLVFDDEILFFFLHINFFCWAWPVSLQAKSWNFMDFVTKDFDERDRDRFHVAKDPDKKAMFGKKQYKFRLKSLFGYLPGTWNSFFFNHVETCNHPKETTVFHGCFKF